jgi:hypothetical protein
VQQRGLLAAPRGLSGIKTATLALLRLGARDPSLQAWASGITQRTPDAAVVAEEEGEGEEEEEEAADEGGALGCTVAKKQWFRASFK